MGLIRGFARGVVALISVGIALMVLIPAVTVVASVAVPLLIILAIAAALGAGSLVVAGLPIIIAGLLIAVAAVAIMLLVKGAFGLGLLALKILLFALLLSWLARAIGFSRPRRSRRGRELVGAPVMDVPAPSRPIRDKYDVAAEKELNEELGF